MENLILYHTGFDEIRMPDIRRGRENADFGQGFYLSDDAEFSRRWARMRKGQDTVLNRYALDLSGLRVHRFSRDEEWFDYIYRNRAGAGDRLPEYDVILGPIANDTIYDTFGVITSGILTRQQALSLLMIGPEYTQVVIKSEKAAANLHFLDAVVLSPEEVSESRALVCGEEEAYQTLFAEKLLALAEEK